MKAISRKTATATDSDLSEHHIPIRQQRGDGKAVRPGTLRLFLLPSAEPTNDAVAAKIAAMEGGVAGMLTSSGQAANFFAVFNICEAGDHFIASSAIYGGTYNLFGVTMKKMGSNAPSSIRTSAKKSWNTASAEHEVHLRRDHHQSDRRHLRYREVCGHRTPSWCSSDHRQYLCHAGQLPPDRMGL